jgi:hypothetical protein
VRTVDFALHRLQQYRWNDFLAKYSLEQTMHLRVSGLKALTRHDSKHFVEQNLPGWPAAVDMN